MKLNLKSKILLIGFVSLLLFLIIMKFGNTSALKGKIGAFKVGTPCDDNNKCTVNDAIRPNGKCMGIKNSPTKRAKWCKKWSTVCDESTGQFTQVNNADGAACNDQDSFTSNDQCLAGVCKGTSLCDPDGDGIITDKFKDAKFSAAVNYALGKGSLADITLQDALKTTFLDATFKGIKDISGIECFTKLTTLYLSMNLILDITPLAGLIDLKDLVLSQNKLSDITPLKNLTNLVYLDLWVNKISDATPLAGLTKLQELTIGYSVGDNEILTDLTPFTGLTNLIRLELPGNQISDITPLAGLINLTKLNLGNNKISELAPLANLTKLEWLYLNKNQISDVTPLGGLINLNILYLQLNSIKDIMALINNPGINNPGPGLTDTVCLLGNPDIPQSQWEALADKGVVVICSPT